MKNISKLFVGILFSALVMAPSYAGEMTVTGGATATYTTNGDDASAGKNLAVSNELDFTASGELDNGYTWKYQVQLDGTSTANDDTRLELGTDMGTIGLYVTEAEKTPIIAAFKRITDIIFCVFNKLGRDLLGEIRDMFKEMVGNALNGTACAIEQAIGALMAGINDGIKKGLEPITQGLDWLTGSVGDIGSLLDKVGSYTDTVMSFLECDSLQCKEYKDWTQSGGMRKKPELSFKSMIDNSKLLIIDLT